MGARGSDEQGAVYQTSMEHSAVDVSGLRVEQGSTGPGPSTQYGYNAFPESAPFGCCKCVTVEDSAALLCM